MGPPSTNVRLQLERFHRGPGFWQVSSLHASVHTGTHIDTPLHCFAAGSTTSDARLTDLCGRTALFRLDAGPSEAVTNRVLEAADRGFVMVTFAVLATGWSDAHWGDFPKYYVESPYLAESGAAGWLSGSRKPRSSTSLKRNAHVDVISHRKNSSCIESCSAQAYTWSNIPRIWRGWMVGNLRWSLPFTSSGIVMDHQPEFLLSARCQYLPSNRPGTGCRLRHPVVGPTQGHRDQTAKGRCAGRRRWPLGDHASWCRVSG
jgi:hypothetical protein